MSLEQEYEKALKIALQFIKFRPRSKGEVRKKLITKQVKNTTINDVLSYLEELRWINDEDFTRLWVSTRLHSKYIGPYRIKQELLLKEIDVFMIEESIEEHYSELPLEQWALSFLKNKYRERIQDIDEDKLVKALIRNGYDYNTAKSAIQLMKDNLDNKDEQWK